VIASRLWILEGPDGSGKSMLADALVGAGGALAGAHRVHCGPFPRVGRGLARLYVEAMLPALLGHRDVVMDRSWLSEPIYAQARRHAPSRLDAVDLRMLERVAARCQTVVVRCLPALDRCLAAYRERRPTEYLKSEAELRAVWDLYAAGLRTTLPTVTYDFTRGLLDYDTSDAGALSVAPSYDYAVGVIATRPHPLAASSAGHLDAAALLVGDRLDEIREHDPLLRLPFVGLSGSGAARWLAAQLERARIPESKLLWACAGEGDGLRPLLAAPGVRPRIVVALGDAASRAVDHDVGLIPGVEVICAEDPRRARQQSASRPYELIKRLEARL